MDKVAADAEARTFIAIRGLRSNLTYQIFHQGRDDLKQPLSIARRDSTPSTLQARNRTNVRIHANQQNFSNKSTGVFFNHRDPNTADDDDDESDAMDSENEEDTPQSPDTGAKHGQGMYFCVSQVC